MKFLLGKFKFSKQEIGVLSLFILIFLFNDKSSYASGFGLGVGELMNTFIQFLVYLFRFIAAIAIIGAVFMAFTGRINWTIAISIICGAAVIGNIDLILDKLGLTKGVIF